MCHGFPPFDGPWTICSRAVAFALASFHRSVMQFVCPARWPFRCLPPISADANGRARIEWRTLPAGRQAASGLFRLLTNQPGVDPACEKPQLASTADPSGSQLTALNCAVDRLRPTPRSLRCLTNLQPSNGIVHGPPLLGAANL